MAAWDLPALMGSVSPAGFLKWGPNSCDNEPHGMALTYSPALSRQDHFLPTFLPGQGRFPGSCLAFPARWKEMNTAQQCPGICQLPTVGR